VRQFGYLPELYEDARCKKYKKFYLLSKEDKFIYDKVKKIIHETVWFGPDPTSLPV
jgi:hypothetical protein